MAEKPRVKAPKQRAAAADDSARRRRTWAIAAAVLGVGAGVAAVAALLGFVGGSDKVDVAAVRTSMKAAGCGLQVAPALKGPHSILKPTGTSPLWNTDPPTSGPHYAIPGVFGIYEEPVDMARLVHDLEHGGIYILYGDKVPDSTVDRLRAYYDDHKTGTIMAPLDRLGNEFAVGAWVVEGDVHNGFLAQCKTFDENALSSFFSQLQFRGPERFDPSQLAPGH
jgi:uncharacterized protein DUF3105